MLGANQTPIFLPEWIHSSYSQNIRGQETQMGELVVPLTVTTNNKPPKWVFPFYFHNSGLSWFRRSSSTKGTIVQYEAETSYWPLHDPQKKVLAKTINLCYEECFCRIMEVKESDRRIQSFLVLPFPWQRWIKDSRSNKLVTLPNP